MSYVELGAPEEREGGDVGLELGMRWGLYSAGPGGTCTRPLQAVSTREDHCFPAP